MSDYCHIHPPNMTCEYEYEESERCTATVHCSIHVPMVLIDGSKAEDEFPQEGNLKHLNQRNFIEITLLFQKIFHIVNIFLAKIFIFNSIFNFKFCRTPIYIPQFHRLYMYSFIELYDSMTTQQTVCVI